jgi:hypothetical protein
MSDVSTVKPLRPNRFSCLQVHPIEYSEISRPTNSFETPTIKSAQSPPSPTEITSPAFSTDFEEQIDHV